MPSENLSYIFAAFTVTWAFFFIYVFFVSRRQKELEREIRDLRANLRLEDNPNEPQPRTNG